MPSDEYRWRTLSEEDSSEEFGDCVNGMICNLPVKDTVVGNEAAAILSQTKQLTKQLMLYR